MCTEADTVNFCGLKFRAATREAIFSRRDKFTIIITVNADFIVAAHEQKRFARIINDNHSTFDGQIPYVLAKFLANPKKSLIEKISGSDFIVEMLNDARLHQKRVFMLGASPTANSKAIKIAQDKFGIEADGYSPPKVDYPFPEEWNAEIIRKISEFQPDYLLVAFGAPKQEFWLDENRGKLEELGLTLCIGCGGSLDFLSGEIRRAPKWAQSLGLEGIYRLIMEPKWFRLKRLLRSLNMFKYIFH